MTWIPARPQAEAYDSTGNVNVPNSTASAAQLQLVTTDSRVDDLYTFDASSDYIEAEADGDYLIVLNASIVFDSGSSPTQFNAARFEVQKNGSSFSPVFYAFVHMSGHGGSIPYNSAAAQRVETLAKGDQLQVYFKEASSTPNSMVTATEADGSVLSVRLIT